MAKAQTPAGFGRILYCHCAHAQVVPEAVREEVLHRLHASGVPFDAVPDLCGLAAKRDDNLRQLASERPLRIAACFPRAVRWMLATAGIPLPTEGVEILNMRTMSADEVVVGLLGGVREEHTTRDAAETDQIAAMRTAVEAGPADGWIPWFPVIDADRCGNCQQCLSFCLFGVYGHSETGQVEVQRPENCKTDCPACARICPEAAIIFPKYGAPPINGAEVRPEDVQREAMAVDVSARLGGNLHQMLRERSAQAKRRFSPDQTQERALEERKRCMCKCRTATGVPLQTPGSRSGEASGGEPPRSTD
ncbi:MAG: ferredoxin family protein [Phycisphaerae bacterium]|jgi:NAD-dependent dihydropyrimidine dehydrogenase PreA subunit